MCYKWRHSGTLTGLAFDICIWHDCFHRNLKESTKQNKKKPPQELSSSSVSGYKISMQKFVLPCTSKEQVDTKLNIQNHLQSVKKILRCKSNIYRIRMLKTTEYGGEKNQRFK